MNDQPAAPLAPTALCRRCDPAELDFETTDELTDRNGVMGQERALAALEFGVGMRGDGYNLFALGRPGGHQHQIVREFLERQVAHRHAARAWIYLNNFDDERKPVAASLPAGLATALKRDMVQLIDELRAAIPAAFESEHYRSRISEINQEFEERHRKWVEATEQEAAREGVSLTPTPQGFAMAPIRNGALLSDEQFERLPPEERQRTRDAVARVSERLRRHVEEIQQWQKEHRERIRAFDREVTGSAIARPISRLQASYGHDEKLGRYLEAVREDVLANAQLFQPGDDREATFFGTGVRMQLRRYEVNVLVDHDTAAVAPVVYESNPSVQNLLGRAEYVAQLGALVTDFTMIRPGALHRANDGYLIIDAQRVLAEPFAWQALKRALYAREVRIESLGQWLSLVSTASLEPEPIPLALKVILIGDREIYYLLSAYDSDFADLFKVAADFEDRIERNAANTKHYAHLIGTLVRREKLRPFNRTAVARVIDHGARLLGDAGKLTTHLRDVTDLLRESDYWAGHASAAVTDVSHVERAIAARERRADRLRDEIRDEILRNSILIDTSGAAVAQVNGLSVIQLGDFAFGRPSRITATARIGRGEVVDIERETELGGPIHSKGVMILTSYLAARYVPRRPLSLRASLVFEQSYSMVDGDSASVAETCALLSALADIPILQRFAVTGSVNQRGEIQVIGGVNEKIEGFFDVCRARGLDGQGVLIPRENIKHLMLRADVVDAARAGQFHVHAVATVDEAISLLTGRPAGERGPDGRYPPDTINHAVEQTLETFAEARREFDGMQRPVTASLDSSTARSAQAR